MNSKENHKHILNSWGLSSTLLSDQWATEEINKFLDSTENVDTTYQKLWGTAKTVLRGKFTAISTHMRKLYLK
jgi:hypothetical protein